MLALLLLGSLTPCPLEAQVPKKTQEPLSRFGNKQLKGVELIAEITVGRIYRMGLGVDVVKIRVDRTLLNRLPPSMAGQPEQLVLAHQNEFTQGTNLLVFLQRYNRSERLTTLHRISHLEKNYKDKVRLIEAYVGIESMRDEKARLEALVRMVLTNLEDDSFWIRCYSTWELDGLIENKMWKFTSGDVAYLEGIEKDANNPAFKKYVADAREQMAAMAVEGPPSIEMETGKNVKKEKKEAGDGENGTSIEKAPE
jgi:hypothetical protein